MEWSLQDIRFMRLCLLLAQKGEGKVSPNPIVGCVVVKYGKIIGKGFHEKFGGPHAEANALAGIGAKARGATLYVTLEPCSHSFPGKKTAPCVPLITKSGIKRVVVAARDSNPEIDGFEKLMKAGIEVTAGVLSKEAEQQNEAYFKFMKTGEPFVVAKMAQSSNGKIGVRGKGNVRISGKKFCGYAQRMRNRCDSILVGINTVLSDDPLLTCRIPGGRSPARIILDSKLQIPLDAKVLNNARREKVIVATSEKIDAEKAAGLERLGAIVIAAGKEKVMLGQLLCLLPQFGIFSVLMEGGAQVISSALSERLVDRAIVSVSKKKIDSPVAISSPFTAKMLSTFDKRKMGSDTVYERSFKA